MPTLLTTDQMYDALVEFIGTYSSQREAAIELDISPSQLSEMLTRRREVTAKMAAKLGYVRDYCYIAKERY